MINRIILGDCLEVMKDIPDNFIDSVICDPPYGTTCVAALQNNRKFIGIEKHKPYFDLANSRISDIMNLMDFAEWV